MTVLREPGLFDTVHTLLPVRRRNWLYRAFCRHDLDDRVPYTRIDHRAGPGWMADNYKGQACKSCGWVVWETKAEDEPRMGHVPPRPMPPPAPARPTEANVNAQRRREAAERTHRQQRREAYLSGEPDPAPFLMPVPVWDPTSSVPAPPAFSSGGGGDYGGGGSSGSWEASPSPAPSPSSDSCSSSSSSSSDSGSSSSSSSSSGSD